MLEYDEDGNVKAWGLSTFQTKRNRGSRVNTESTQIAELFKLNLSEKEQLEKLPLPAGIDHKKAISDFLREMGKVSRFERFHRLAWALEFPVSTDLNCYNK